MQNLPRGMSASDSGSKVDLKAESRQARPARSRFCSSPFGRFAWNGTQRGAYPQAPLRYIKAKYRCGS